MYEEENASSQCNYVPNFFVKFSCLNLLYNILSLAFQNSYKHLGSDIGPNWTMVWIVELLRPQLLQCVLHLWQWSAVVSGFLGV